MSKNKIDFLKEALSHIEYNFINVGDYEVEIQFPNCKVVMSQTLQDTIYLKILDKNNKKIFKNTYKTINNAIKYGLKNINY